MKQVLLYVIFIGGFLLIISVLPAYFPSNRNRQSPKPVNPTSINMSSDYKTRNNIFKFNTSKKILYYTNFFGMRDWKFGFGNKAFVSNQCPEQNCFITRDHNLLPSLADFDAVLFHAREANIIKAVQVES